MLTSPRIAPRFGAPRRLAAARRSATGLLVLGMTGLTAMGCKPEKPDLVKERLEQATTRAQAAKRAAERGALVRMETPRGLSSEEAARVVAQVGETTITVGDVARHIDSQPRHLRARWASPEHRRELVDRMVEMEILAQEALREGLDRSPAVQHALKVALARELLGSVDGSVSGAEVDAQAVQRFYMENKERYVRPERRRAALIVAQTQETAADVGSRIAALAAKEPNRARVIFGDFAEETSEDRETRKRRGDLGWFDREGRNQADQIKAAGVLADTAWGLGEVGAIGAPVELESKLWGLVQLTGREPSQVEPLGDVEAAIKDELLRSKAEAARRSLLADLMSAAAIEVHEEVLSSLPEPKPAPARAGAAGATPVEVKSAADRAAVRARAALPTNAAGMARRLLDKKPKELEAPRPQPPEGLKAHIADEVRRQADEETRRRHPDAP